MIPYRNEAMAKTTMEEDSTTILKAIIGMIDQKISNQGTTSNRQVTNGTIKKATTTNTEGTPPRKNTTEVDQIGDQFPMTTASPEKTQAPVWGEEDQATDC